MNNYSNLGRAVLTGTGLLLTFLVACAQVKGTEYRSDTARFSALFPGTPTESIKTVNTDIGPIEMKMYGVSKEQAAFNVVVSDYPAKHVKEHGSTAILNGNRDGAVQNTQGKLLSELIINVAGHPGRELKISTAGGKATIRSKIILVGNRLYQVVAVTRAADSYAPEIDRFLESFKLQ